MADARFRDLERAAQGGDLDAGARLLRERVRLGDLALERLHLAAYLGDPAARLAAGDAVACVDWEEQRAGATSQLRAARRYPRAWAARLATGWGQEAVVRAARAALDAELAAADVAVEADAMAASRDAVARWLEVGEAAREACVEAGDAATLATELPADALGPRDRHLLLAAGLVAYTAGSLVAESAADGLVHVLGHVSEAWRLRVGAAEPDDPPSFRRAVREAVRAGVVPWALGWPGP